MSIVSKPVQQEALLTLNQIEVRRNHNSILRQISLKVKRGEIITLIGPNGAGKSTLIKVALGLIKPTRGTVVRQPAMEIGYVPQNIDIEYSMPMTVKRFLKLREAVNDDQIRQTLQQASAEILSETSLHHLSGGELRRVLLARALLKPPDLLILDEPTAGVDVNGQTELFSLIQSIRDRYHCGVLLVSHDLHIVMASTDHVICLNQHVCCSGTPENISRDPEFVALFGHHHAENLAVYRHHHDHVHHLDGAVSVEHHDNSGVHHPHG